MRKLLVFLLVFVVLPFSALAHSGGTDSMGGHYNRSTGEYHFHHGYSEHQHTGGKCPYDKSGRTNWPTAKPDLYASSSSSSSSSSKYSKSVISYASRATPRPTIQPTAVPRQESDGVSGSSLVYAFGGGAAAAAAGSAALRALRKRS